ncbi:adenylate/guanylate cyclase domain-containing protein, partial [Stenotrophomonas sp. YIM B06876]|uniref:adenylate/guanylate cyclase domain-containing protein n=1 Tax=Stenotrophomonas sp. YIM B06876 TaxID=3060211 RepID=UPI00273A3598
MSAHATVLFADLSGSTSLYEAWGNERAAEAVTRLTQWIGDVVQGHEGRVVKKLGDGVLGVFGHAGQAIAAAGELQRC